MGVDEEIEACSEDCAEGPEDAEGEDDAEDAEDDDDDEVDDGAVEDG